MQLGFPHDDAHAMLQPRFITYYLPAYRTFYIILYYLRPRDMIPRPMCYSLTMQAKEKREKQGFLFCTIICISSYLSLPVITYSFCVFIFGPFDSRQVRVSFHHRARMTRMEWDMIMTGGFSAFV